MCETEPKTEPNSVRFSEDLLRFRFIENYSDRFGSVCCYMCIGSVRFRFYETYFGSVRFGVFVSAFGSVRFKLLVISVFLSIRSEPNVNKRF